MKKIVFILVIFFLFQRFYPTETVEISDIKHDNVILYATAWCGYCKKTRAFLAKNNIQYTEYNIEKSKEGRLQYEALGGGGVPVLDIKGTIIHGYSVQKIESTFKQLNLM